ncbi:MAG: STAS domain-containing protein [SAR324 cluster bacterium]|nr:STAS domain-containing protein [SAR324 cluster bacterium]
MAPLQVGHYKENNLYIVTVGDNLTVDTVATFNQYVKPLMEDVLKTTQMRGLILNMKKVFMVDSSGVGTICGKLIKLKKAEKKMVLCNVNKTVTDTFADSGLGSALTYYSSVQEAIAIIGRVETPVREESVPIVKKPVFTKAPPKERGLENFMDKKARNRK